MTINLKMPDITELKPRITVFGVGGAGGNAVNNMITSNLEGVDFVVANTDSQALKTSKADRVIQMGIAATDGRQPQRVGIQHCRSRCRLSPGWRGVVDLKGVRSISPVRDQRQPAKCPFAHRSREPAHWVGDCRDTSQRMYVLQCRLYSPEACRGLLDKEAHHVALERRDLGTGYDLHHVAHP